MKNENSASLSPAQLSASASNQNSDASSNTSNNAARVDDRLTLSDLESKPKARRTLRKGDTAARPGAFAIQEPPPQIPSASVLPLSSSPSVALNDGDSKAYGLPSAGVLPVNTTATSQVDESSLGKAATPPPPRPEYAEGNPRLDKELNGNQHLQNIVEEGTKGDENDDTKPQLEDEDLQDPEPVILAELVAPPVEAVPVILEEGEDDQDDGESSDLEEQSHREETSMFRSMLCKGPPMAFGCRAPMLALICLVVVVVVVIAVAVSSRSSSEPEIDDCYTSTRDLVLAQLSQPNRTLFVLCPRNTIRVGRFRDSLVDDFRTIDGDWPLYVARSNLEIRCGADGSVANDCRLEGGSFQILTAYRQQGSDGFTDLGDQMDDWNTGPAVVVNNVTIRGLTFTGEMAVDEKVGGATVAIFRRTDGFQFVDCRWEDLTTVDEIFYVGTGAEYDHLGMALAESYSMSVSLIRCTFRNLIYNGIVIAALLQRLRLERVRFEDARLPFFGSRCTLEQFRYCQMMVVCLHSRCELSDICVNNVEHNGPAALLAYSNISNVSLTGSVTVGNTSQHTQYPGITKCPSGIVEYQHATRTHQCVTDPNWILISECPL